jgi:hypothetical protein
MMIAMIMTNESMVGNEVAGSSVHKTLKLKLPACFGQMVIVVV